MSDAAPAARGALRILAHLGAARGPVAAGQLASATGLPRASVYRLLGVLEQEGFVLRFPEAHRWGIGIAAFELAGGYHRQAPLTRLGRPIVEALVDRVGENAHLAALHGRDVLYLIEERAPRRRALVTDVGVRLPAHVTASGLAQLAALPRAQVRALFPDAAAFAQRGTGGPRSSADLRRVLAAAAARGWAVEDGEVTEGVASVAVAVRDHAGWPVAALAVTFERGQEAPEDRADLAAVVAEHAALLARRLGA
ncbi:IclR family transcriptional regulator [uncultured Amnibacterium sp.]|uniref:IclR family transcriptional regulator n=1 Tax=uncultured Amnibacterium sp. TaxID=1631851 RepID=UPI0035C965E3